MDYRNTFYSIALIIWRTMVVIFCLGTVSLNTDLATAANDGDDLSVITIQAEDYDQGGQGVAYYDKTPGNAGGQYRSDDVDIWWYGPSTYYVGANSTGEWLEYTIDVPFEGNYLIGIRAATANMSRRIHIDFGGADETGPLVIHSAGGWTTWRTLNADVRLSAGRQTMRLVIDNGGLNIDWISLAYKGAEARVATPTIEPDGGTFIDSVEVTLATATADATINYTIDGSDPCFSITSLYYDRPFTLSEDTLVRVCAMKFGQFGIMFGDEAVADFILDGATVIKVQAEDYDLGGQGVAFYDKTPGNNGGQYRSDDVDIWRYGTDPYYTGANATGEWLNYTVDIPSDGNYRLDIRMSTPNRNRRVHVDFDGVDETGSLTLPLTGGWTSFQTFSTNVALSAGRQVMRLAIDYGGLNIDWISLEYIGDEWIWYGHFDVKDNDDLMRLAGYTAVTGNLVIFQTSLTSLAELNSLTSVGGRLIIDYNSNLTSLEGLNGLTSVGESLSIFGNDNLTSLSRLNNLTNVGRGLAIAFNPSLTNLEGLNHLTSVRGGMSIMVNSTLTSLEGLNGLTSVGGSFSLDSNTKLADLLALRNLTSVVGPLCIYQSPNLTSLEGLNNLTSVGGLSIVGNTSLTSLEGLNNNLSSFVGRLDISDNANLTSLGNLSNLTSVGEFVDIATNDKLTSLTDLKSLSSIGDYLSISFNKNLIDLSLNNLNSVGSDFHICSNPLLDQPLVEELRDQVLSRGGIGGIINAGPDCY